MKFLIQLKCKTILEQHFHTKLKRNLTSAIEVSHHNANTAFFDQKKVNNLLKKADNFKNQYYDRNGTKLSLIYLWNCAIKQKKFESAA